MAATTTAAARLASPDRQSGHDARRRRCVHRSDGGDVTATVSPCDQLEQYGFFDGSAVGNHLKAEAACVATRRPAPLRRPQRRHSLRRRASSAVTQTVNQSRIYRAPSSPNPWAFGQPTTLTAASIRRSGTGICSSLTGAVGDVSLAAARGATTRRWQPAHLHANTRRRSYGGSVGFGVRKPSTRSRLRPRDLVAVSWVFGRPVTFAATVNLSGPTGTVRISFATPLGTVS